jgi:hypothetical protein
MHISLLLPWEVEQMLDSVASIRKRAHSFRNRTQDIKWPYFHTLSIFYTNDQWKSTFYSNDHIFTHWVYFTQISNESQIFSQMAIISHIEHSSHKYPMKVYFLLKWSYFHTLSIFHTTIQWKSNSHSNDHIFTNWAYFTQISNESQIFTQMAIFSHIKQILHKYPRKVKFSLNWQHFHTLSIFHTIIFLLSVALLFFFWNSWLFHCGHCTSMELHWPMKCLSWSSRWWKQESHQID